MKAINVDNVLKILNEYGAFVFVTDSERYSEMVNKISNLSELKPRTGKWIVHMDCEGKTRYCECDRCGYKTGKYTWKNPNFCENCSADMRGGE